MVIDPEIDKTEEYLGLARDFSLEIVYAIDTHTHADHSSACKILRDRAGLPVVMHRASEAPYVDRRVEEGDVIHTAILPVGSSHITNDLMIGLRAPIDIAERIKIEFGTALPQKVQKKEEVAWSDVGGSEEGCFSRRQVAEIIEARVEEIFKLTDLELAKIERSGKLPAGIVITGGGAKLNGMIGVARKIFKLPASIGAPREVASAIDKVDDPSLATAVGLVRWGERFGFIGGKDNNFFRGQLRSFGGGDVGDKVKRWLKAFMP